MTHSGPESAHEDRRQHKQDCAQTISACQSIELPFTSTELVIVQPGQSGRKQAQSFPLKIGLATSGGVEVSTS